MHIRGWSRRRFFKILGMGTGILSPLAHGVAGWAQGAPKKRLVIIQHPYGSDYPAVDAYWPVPLLGKDKEVALTPTMLRERRVSEVMADISNQLTYVKGLSLFHQPKFGNDLPHPGGGHEMDKGQYSGKTAVGDKVQAAGTSIDQFIASGIGAVTALPSVSLGTNQTAGCGFVRNGVVVPKYYSPRMLIEGAFKNFTPTKPSAPAPQKPDLGDDDLLVPLGDEIKKLRSFFNGTEREKIDQHIAALEDLRRLSGGENGAEPAASCEVPQASAFPSHTSGKPGSEGATLSGDLLKGFVRLVPTLMACDRTRVVTLDLQVGSPLGFLGPLHSHNYSHYKGGPGSAEHKVWQEHLRFAATCFRDIVKGLDAIAEGSGTALDNSVVVWTSFQGIPGANHISAHVPTVMAGRLGGALKPGGRLLNYDPGQHPTGRGQDDGIRFGENQMRFWVSLAKGFGLDPSREYQHQPLQELLA
ncbi:MAG: DUF1552 domain-containing protein [Deltaproteobacteria bacterium]|nr:DUF1552 domain-containing protein [Deltaproteobacteria bacterium]